MNLLAFECSTEQLSVALLCAGELRCREAAEPRRHAMLLLPLVDELLAEAGLQRRQLDAIGFGRGPGAFTGVRLACSVAQGLGFGLDRPVLPVSSLAALAAAGFRQGAAAPLLALLDARMGELYAGAYTLEQGEPVLLGAEQLVAPQQLELPGDDAWCAVGSGWQAQRALLSARFGLRLAGLDGAGRRAPLLPHAREVALLALAMHRRGESCSAFEALPVYLRDKVAQTRAERLAAKAA